MAKLRVKFNVEVTQYIDWPDNELNELTYENLECNLDMDKSTRFEHGDIVDIQKNGEEFNF